MTVWTKDNRKKPVGSKCGAKNRTTGLPCQSFAMPNGRCRLHGGKSNKPAPKGNTLALKHGLYAKGFLEGERDLFPTIKLGTLDDEIRMLKLKLRRAWSAQKMWIEQRGRVEEELESRPMRRLIRSRSQLTVKQHLPISNVETNESLVHDRLGLPHTNISKKILRKKEDYSQEIRALSKLIGQLEMRRKELVGDDPEAVKTLVEEFREFAVGAAETLPGGEM